MSEKKCKSMPEMEEKAESREYVLQLMSADICQIWKVIIWKLRQPKMRPSVIPWVC
jgi:hypothetical protein